MIIKDTRGFHIYDTESDKLKFIKNPYEIFEKIFYDDASVDYNKQDVSDYKDKFIKLIVERRRDYQMFETLVDRLYNVGVHDVKIVETLVDAEDVDDVELNTKDTLTLSEYIDEIELKVDKTDLKKVNAISLHRIMRNSLMHVHNHTARSTIWNLFSFR